MEPPGGDAPLMWNLNEESGGIGWGCPEAMGETMARSARWPGNTGASSFPYLNPEGNFIDHPALQEGVSVGHGRLAHANPPAALEAAFLMGFLPAEIPAFGGPGRLGGRSAGLRRAHSGAGKYWPATKPASKCTTRSS